MTAGVTPEREAEIRAMAWKTGREIDLAHALARMTLALRDALALVDQAREERDEALARSVACEACAAELAEAREERDAARATCVRLATYLVGEADVAASGGVSVFARDHACRRCYTSDITIDGFVCVLHTARDIVESGALPPVSTRLEAELSAIDAALDEAHAPTASPLPLDEDGPLSRADRIAFMAAEHAMICDVGDAYERQLAVALQERDDLHLVLSLLEEPAGMWPHECSLCDERHETECPILTAHKAARPPDPLKLARAECNGLEAERDLARAHAAAADALLRQSSPQCLYSGEDVEAAYLAARDAAKAGP